MIFNDRKKFEMIANAMEDGQRIRETSFIINEYRYV